MSAAMPIDDEAVLAELAAASDSYEAALAENDIVTLDRWFWDDGRTVRFGSGENLYGAAAIREFRHNRELGGLARVYLRRQITAFGRDHAVVHIEFRRQLDQAPGRQTQVWARLNGGWRIVSAHVSMLPKPKEWLLSGRLAGEADHA